MALSEECRAYNQYLEDTARLKKDIEKILEGQKHELKEKLLKNFDFQFENIGEAL